MSEPLRFRQTAFGYDYTWEVISPGLQIDAGGRPFVWCRPVQRHKSSKPGRLSAPLVFHLSHLEPATIEYFRTRTLRGIQTT
jgi:hypothetical protein